MILSIENTNVTLVIFYYFSEVFIGATIVLLGMGTGTSIVVVNLYFKGYGDRRPSDWLRFVVLKCLANVVCMRRTANEALHLHEVCMASYMVIQFPHFLLLDELFRTVQLF